MSLIVISMMTIVALGIVFAENGGCPCNPQPPANVTRENTEGNVQPTNTCMRSWIEYRNCGPRRYAGYYTYDCLCYEDPDFPIYECNWKTCREWTQQCDKYRVWYNNCTHTVIWEDYLGKVTRTGTECEYDWGKFLYPIC